MANVFGYFTLQLNEMALCGNFMDNYSKKLLPEGGIKLTGDKNSFVGTYTTIWRDDAEKISHLTIELSDNEIYKLTWKVISEKGKGDEFTGCGVIERRISGNILNGYYEMS